MRAHPLELRIALFEAIAQRDTPFDAKVVDPLCEALEGLEEPLEITPAAFFDFVLNANIEEIKEVLFTGARESEEKHRAGAAFIAAIAALIRLGQLPGEEARERLAIAGELQAGVV